jgi:hypothetical protein
VSSPPLPLSERTLSRPTGDDKTATVGFDTNQLIQLWNGPIPDGDAAVPAFRAVYADPVTINGRPVAAVPAVSQPAPPAQGG